LTLLWEKVEFFFDLLESTVRSNDVLEPNPERRQNPAR
jgi:hypothetical protein